MQQRRGMTVHRGSAVRGRAVRTAPYTIADAGAALTMLQVCVCVVALVAVFTMQFVNADGFATVGRLYTTVMGMPQEQLGEAVYVGAFGTPITLELLEDCANSLLEKGEDYPMTDWLAAGGGLQPYRPDNLYAGNLAVSARAIYPTYGPVTSAFGWRSHPITGRTDFHTGIDIASPEGADIYAVLPGVVEEVGYSDAYGNYIRVSHGARLATVYNHCSRILATPGAVLRQGERVALVGSTGLSTGAHLHLDVLVDGCYADPMSLYSHG